MKPNIWTKVILPLGIFSIATIAVADDNTTNTNQPLAELTSQQFVSDATVGGWKEIYLSELALEKSTNADIQSFARHMVKDHGAANAKLAKIADAEGLTVPPTNTFSTDDPNWNNPLIANAENFKGAQMLTMTNLPYVMDYQAVLRVKSLAGVDFDRAYVSGMVGDHAQAVSEFETASQTLSDPKLKKFAEKTLPTLRKHSQMAQELSDQQFNSTNGTNTVNQSGSTTPLAPM